MEYDWMFNLQFRDVFFNQYEVMKKNHCGNQLRGLCVFPIFIQLNRTTKPKLDLFQQKTAIRQIAVPTGTASSHKLQW